MPLNVTFASSVFPWPVKLPVFWIISLDPFGGQITEECIALYYVEENIYLLRWDLSQCLLAPGGS